MRNTILLLFILMTIQVTAQESEKYHQFSAGLNVLNGVFKNAEINTEFMFNERLGATCDLGYQFSTSAGKNLNLIHNKIEGYYLKLGPRFYFAPHSSKGNGYLTAGFIHSHFKQSASIDEDDYYEPSKITLKTSQKLQGTYIGLGTLIKMSSNFSLDFGTVLNFFSPQNIDFAQDVNNATNAQPGFGNFIFKDTGNFGMGIGINCSVKYEFVKH